MCGSSAREVEVAWGPNLGLHVEDVWTVCLRCVAKSRSCCMVHASILSLTCSTWLVELASAEVECYHFGFCHLAKLLSCVSWGCAQGGCICLADVLASHAHYL